MRSAWRTVERSARIAAIRLDEHNRKPILHSRDLEQCRREALRCQD